MLLELVSMNWCLQGWATSVLLGKNQLISAAPMEVALNRSCISAHLGVSCLWQLINGHSFMAFPTTWQLHKTNVSTFFFKAHCFTTHVNKLPWIVVWFSTCDCLVHLGWHWEWMALQHTHQNTTHFHVLQDLMRYHNRCPGSLGLHKC